MQKAHFTVMKAPFRQDAEASMGLKRNILKESVSV